jgi:hypothetical protein
MSSFYLDQLEQKCFLDQLTVIEYQIDTIFRFVKTTKNIKASFVIFLLTRVEEISHEFVDKLILLKRCCP